jgi:hypothetical protein
MAVASVICMVIPIKAHPYLSVNGGGKGEMSHAGRPFWGGNRIYCQCPKEKRNSGCWLNFRKESDILKKRDGKERKIHESKVF